MNITAQLNGVNMPQIERDFINTSRENAVDVEPLSGDIYTDFVSQSHTYTFRYSLLTETQYNTLRAVYDSQFTLHTYPELTIDYYNVEDKPARMYINEKDIWNDCGAIRNVEISFRLTSQLPEES